MPRHIYFIRHGETDWNQAQLFQGRTDVPLNVRGRAQAGRTAACIREHFRLAGHPLRFAGLVSSPLSRAVETATIVASALGGSACGLPDDPDDLTGLYLNVSFRDKRLLITTGTARKKFYMDKSLDNAWDSYVQAFLKSFGIAAEPL